MRRATCKFLEYPYCCQHIFKNFLVLGWEFHQNALECRGMPRNSGISSNLATLLYDFYLFLTSSNWNTEVAVAGMYSGDITSFSTFQFPVKVSVPKWLIYGTPKISICRLFKKATTSGHAMASFPQQRCGSTTCCINPKQQRRTSGSRTGNLYHRMLATYKIGQSPHWQ